MAYIGRGLDKISNIEKLDAITFDGSQSYSLTKSSVAFTPNSANSLIISINGVCQFGNVTVSGTSVDFGVAMPSTDTNDFILHLGVGVVNTPADATVTNAKLAQDIISGETELTAEPASTDEFLVSDAGTLKRIDYSLITNTPAFEAYLSSDQAVSDGVDTKVEIDTEVHDTDGCYDHATNYRFTPDVAGKYFIYGSTVGYGGAITDIISSKVMIYKNGAYYAGSETNYNANLIQRSYNTVSSVIDMNGSSDYLELYGFVNGNSGGSEVFSNAVGSKSNLFGGYKLTGV